MTAVDWNLRDQVFRFGFALFCTSVATYIRVCLTPYIGDRIPFGTYFLSVMLVAWLAGPMPAVLALMLSMFAAAHFIVAPEGSWLIYNSHDQIAMGIFFLVGSISIGLFHRLDSRRTDAENEAKKNELLNRKLVESDRRKDEFLSLLSHELRCPLAPMGYAVDVLYRVADDPERVRNTSQLFSRNLSHLTRLVDDLLDVSRFSRGTLKLKNEIVDFRDCVCQAVEMVRPLSEEKEHELFVVVPDEEVIILADPVRCTQIICNLLTNAVKYTPAQGRIQLTTTSGPQCISTVVEDNGIGLSESIQQQVFEPFFQAHSKRSRFSAGMGLGLAIANKLASLHGGNIDLNSEGLGRGSRFSFILPNSVRRQRPVEQPLARSSSQPLHETAVQFANETFESIAADVLSSPIEFSSADEAGETGLPTAENSRGRVIIVDDDRDTANSLAFLLSLEGFETEIAFEGMKALHLFRSFRPHHIVLDIGLPGIDGYEIARRIRNEPDGSAARIIAASGWGSGRDRDLGREAGFDAHLVKPINIADLIPLLATGPRQVST